MIVNGARDAPDYVALGEGLEEQITRAQRKVIEDAGHIVYMERPHQFNEVVDGFLFRQLTRW